MDQLLSSKTSEQDRSENAIKAAGVDSDPLAALQQSGPINPPAAFSADLSLFPDKASSTNLGKGFHFGDAITDGSIDLKKELHILVGLEELPDGSMRLEVFKLNREKIDEAGNPSLDYFQRRISKQEFAGFKKINSSDLSHKVSGALLDYMRELLPACRQAWQKRAGRAAA